MKNREIKFRAWDKVNNQLIYDNQDKIVKPNYLKSWSCEVFSRPSVTNKGVSFWIYETKLPGADDQTFDHISGLPYNSLEIMQFTGLKDKNGKEIYEGDIVRNIKPEECSSYEKFQVIFQGVSFQYKPIENAHIKQYTIDPITCFTEIVGNIYENPELLK